MPYELSIVICAYTEKRWTALIAAIESVQHQTLPAREIILVIDHNPALFQQAQACLANVIVIENSRDKGLSGARNSGWTRTQGEIIAFLDDDAVAEPDWIEKLAGYYYEPMVVGVGGKILPLWEKDAPRWFPEEFNWVIGCTYRGMSIKKGHLRNVIGANMSIRRSVLEASGGFQEALGWDKNTNGSEELPKWFSHSAGDEETELCIRISQQFPGSIWQYGAKAVVHHRVSIKRTNWRYFSWRCYHEGMGKASLVKLHTSNTGLSSERTYVLQALPIGILDNLADTFLRRNASGLLRAGAILLGLTTTVLGYFIGSISSLLPLSQNSDDMQHPSILHNTPLIPIDIR